ncbi:G1/S-specific cyclin-D3-like [Rhodnius prolixus]
MDLLCTERAADCSAYSDPMLLDDPRVLKNLLKTEEIYTTNSSYFQNVQTEITPEMRKIVAEWMLEVCEEERCQDEVFPLAMNIMDRYLSLVNVKKTHLQMLGTVCLLLATKLRQPNPLMSMLLSSYTDYSAPVEDIPGWELMVACRLKWDLAAVTPIDFVGHILHRLPLDSELRAMVTRHAHTFISLAARESKFCMFTPSIIAGASVASALNGIRWSSRGGWPLSRLMDMLSRLLFVEKEYLCTCLGQLEEMLSDSLSQAAQALQQQQEMEDESQPEFKPQTPTDVNKVHF